MFSLSSLPCRGLARSQACINFCFGYSVFLETHLQAIINSLECWQNIQTCRQASDDTTLGKSSGSWPNSEEGEEERNVCSRERREKVPSELFPLCYPVCGPLSLPPLSPLPRGMLSGWAPLKTWGGTVKSPPKERVFPGVSSFTLIAEGEVSIPWRGDRRKDWL